MQGERKRELRAVIELLSVICREREREIEGELMCCYVAETGEEVPSLRLRALLLDPAIAFCESACSGNWYQGSI